MLTIEKLKKTKAVAYQKWQAADREETKRYSAYLHAATNLETAKSGEDAQRQDEKQVYADLYGEDAAHD